MLKDPIESGSCLALCFVPQVSHRRKEGIPVTIRYRQGCPQARKHNQIITLEKVGKDPFNGGPCDDGWLLFVRYCGLIRRLHVADRCPTVNLFGIIAAVNPESCHGAQHTVRGDRRELQAHRFSMRLYSDAGAKTRDGSAASKARPRSSRQKVKGNSKTSPSKTT